MTIGAPRHGHPQGAGKRRGPVSVSPKSMFALKVWGWCSRRWGKARRVTTTMLETSDTPKSVTTLADAHHGPHRYAL
jgi:hypothetical protein